MFYLFLAKKVEFSLFQDSWPRSAPFGPKRGLPGPRRKTLYKRKVLGAVLEARNRGSALFTQKVRNSARKQEFYKIVGFRKEKCTFRESTRNVPNHYLFCFENM